MAAHRALVDSDAAVLVLSADSQLSQRELDLLIELWDRRAKVFVVTDKANHSPGPMSTRSAASSPTVSVPSAKGNRSSRSASRPGPRSRPRPVRPPLTWLLRVPGCVAATRPGRSGLCPAGLNDRGTASTSVRVDELMKVANHLFNIHLPTVPNKARVAPSSATWSWLRYRSTSTRGLDRRTARAWLHVCDLLQMLAFSSAGAISPSQALGGELHRRCRHRTPATVGNVEARARRRLIGSRRRMSPLCVDSGMVWGNAPMSRMMPRWALARTALVG
jgi:hypothetical protein